MAKLSEGTISKTLWRKYGIGQIAAANIYAWAFESDLLILRKSGYAVEYEIKLSVGDWNAGLKKQVYLHGSDKTRTVKYTHKLQTSTTRHEYLTQGYGANMFYYVAPEEVLEKVEIPEWAGVIVARENRSANFCITAIRKNARFLHKNPQPPGLKEKILTSCYYKYWQHYAAKDINLLRRTK